MIVTTSKMGWYFKLEKEEIKKKFKIEKKKNIKNQKVPKKYYIKWVSSVQPADRTSA